MGKINIGELCEDARYSHALDSLLARLGIVEVLQLSYESDWQGYVDIDALLADGRVFSYRYSYGSCSGCDDWEYRGLSGSEIESEMEREATFFNSRVEWDAWQKMKKEGNP